MVLISQFASFLTIHWDYAWKTIFLHYFNSSMYHIENQILQPNEGNAC